MLSCTRSVAESILYVECTTLKAVLIVSYSGSICQLRVVTSTYTRVSLERKIFVFAEGIVFNDIHDCTVAETRCADQA